MHEREFELLPGLADHSRVDLDLVRTAVQPLPRLSAELGIRLFVKRDDMLPLAMGGNKVRQLEYYFGPARDAGADTILITGAVQSNFVRLCAAAARRMGWHPVIQLEDRVSGTDASQNNSGNVLIDRLLGAEIHHFHEGENEAAADANLDRLAERKRDQGRKPYVIHLGTDHPPLGGLGYALCAAETFLQCGDAGAMPDCVVMASGSGLTHGGFLAGARAMGWQVPVHGICVRRDATLQTPRILQRSAEIADLLQSPQPPVEDDIRIDDTVFHPGYGQMNEAVIEALKMAASHEALLLDPVYTGRTMAGLISLVQRSIIEQGQSVLFLHTGGLPGLFAYEEKLRDQIA